MAIEASLQPIGVVLALDRLGARRQP